MHLSHLCIYFELLVGYGLILSYVFNLLGRVGKIEGAFVLVTNVMCAPVCLCVFVRSSTCVCVRTCLLSCVVSV